MQPEKNYSEYLKNKSVILVGPARYLVGQNKGEEIDNFDIVVRMNTSLPIPKKYEKDLGSRTDVLYHRLSGNIFPTAEDIKNWNDVGVKWVVTKAQKTNNRSKKFKDLIKNYDIAWETSYKVADEIKKYVERTPNQGLITILHLLNYSIKSLMVMGCDFYATGYHLGYKGITSEKEIEKIRVKSREGKLHNNPSQIIYLSKIWKDEPRFDVDEVLEKILTSKDVLTQFGAQSQKIKEVGAKTKKKKKNK